MNRSGMSLTSVLKGFFMRCTLRCLEIFPNGSVMEPVLDAGRKIVHDADGRQETRKIIRESIPIHGKPKAIQERKKLFRLLPDFLSFLRSEPRSGGTFYANSRTGPRHFVPCLRRWLNDWR